MVPFNSSSSESAPTRAEEEQLSKLIGFIYDAALEPQTWATALDGIRTYVGGVAANIYWQDFTNANAGMHKSLGDDPFYRQRYIEEYAPLNPLYPAAAFFECGRVYSANDIIPFVEMRETRFYKEWMQPQGILDSVCANLERSATANAAIAIIRSENEGLADEAARRRLSLIVPHLVRAISISHVIDRHETANAVLSETLGHLSAGVFMVDADARIAFANHAARSILERGNVLQNSMDILTAIDPKADRTLQQAISASSGGDLEIGARGSALPLTSTGPEHWIAHVLPLTSGARREAGVTFAATAAVFVRKTGIDIPSALETFSKVYALTASEVRVLRAVTETGGVPEVATALGISQSTVRSHLDSLFNKTGVRRQADLIKMLLGAGNPF